MPDPATVCRIAQLNIQAAYTIKRLSQTGILQLYQTGSGQNHPQAL